jgi:nucleoside-diphosphate-sugar epimerase
MTPNIDETFSRPTTEVIEFLGKLDGDILFLGAAGKMGPHIVTMALRASQQAGVARRVIAVSRFSDASVQQRLADRGVEIIAGDLLCNRFVAGLPECENVFYMVGAKFGTSGAAARTWAVNACLPGTICQKFANSRIACFSTGNIYGLVPRATGGSVESDPPNPVGEYAMSCLGRERVFEFYSRRDSIPVSILRINYSTELRYGVLVDVATQVFAREPIDLSMGYFNVIWQPDACAMALRSLAVASTEPTIMNVTGPEVASVRAVADRFGELLDRVPVFEGRESETALLSNSAKACELFGAPAMRLDAMIEQTADWVANGGVTWDKPTHFAVRDGKF